MSPPRAPRLLRAGARRAGAATIPATAATTIADVLAGRARAVDAVYDGAIVPANLGLAEAELVLGGKMGRELTLRRALRELAPRYDLVLIDCPPSLGLLTVNALVAADHAVISSEAEYFSLQGVEQALEVIELAKDNLRPELDWLGVLLNIADMRLVHARDALRQLRERFGEKVFGTVIRRSVRYAESAERGVSILDYAPDLGADYLALADELLGRLGFGEERERVAELRAELARAGGRGAGGARVGGAPQLPTTRSAGRAPVGRAPQLPTTTCSSNP